MRRRLLEESHKSPHVWMNGLAALSLLSRLLTHPWDLMDKKTITVHRDKKCSKLVDGAHNTLWTFYRGGVVVLKETWHPQYELKHCAFYFEASFLE